MSRVTCNSATKVYKVVETARPEAPSQSPARMAAALGGCSSAAGMPKTAPGSFQKTAAQVLPTEAHCTHPGRAGTGAFPRSQVTLRSHLGALVTLG